MSELILSGKNGILVKQKNPKLLADAINFLCNNNLKSKKWEIMGIGLLKKYSQNNIKQLRIFIQKYCNC